MFVIPRYYVVHSSSTKSGGKGRTSTSFFLVDARMAGWFIAIAFVIISTDDRNS